MVIGGSVSRIPPSLSIIFDRVGKERFLTILI